MHGNVFGGCVFAFVLDQHTNACAVQVSSDLGATGHALEAAKAHVLTDLADQAFANFFQCWTEAVLGVGQFAQCSHVGWVVQSSQFGGRIGQGQEAVVFGHKVCFAVDFEHGACVAFCVGNDHAFGGDAGSGFACFCTQFNAQQLFCFGHVAIGFSQCFFAFHHGGICFGAQFSDHACGNSHLISPFRLRIKVRAK